MGSLLKDSEGRTDRLNEFARRRKQFKSSCRTGRRPNRLPQVTTLPDLLRRRGTNGIHRKQAGVTVREGTNPLNKLRERKSRLIFETPCLLRGRPLIVHVEAWAYDWARRDEAQNLRSVGRRSTTVRRRLQLTDCDKLAAKENEHIGASRSENSHLVSPRSLLAIQA